MGRIQHGVLSQPHRAILGLAQEGGMDILPPLLPSLSTQLEAVLQHIHLLPLHDVGPAQETWPRISNPMALLHSQSQLSEFQLRAVRDPSTGHVIDWEEVRSEQAGSTARNSSSLQRAPGPPEEATRGSTTNFPFWPGGFDLPDIPIDTIEPIE